VTLFGEVGVEVVVGAAATSSAMEIAIAAIVGYFVIVVVVIASYVVIGFLSIEYLIVCESVFGKPSQINKYLSSI
jgi:hypothetical protein